MTLGGWIIMILSVGCTTALFVWSFVKILQSPEDPAKLHGFEPASKHPGEKE